MITIGILLLTLLGGCSGSEADESMLPPLTDPPRVPALGLPPPAPASPPRAPTSGLASTTPQPATPTQDLGPPTGVVLAEWDMSSNADFVPLGSGIAWGPLDGGNLGASWKNATGNAGFCSPFVAVSTDFRVDASIELSRIADAAPGQAGLKIEVRAFDVTRNILPAPLGTRTLAVFQQPAPLSVVAWKYIRPEAARFIRVCARMDRATGDASMNRLLVSTL